MTNFHLSLIILAELLIAAAVVFYIHAATKAVKELSEKVLQFKSTLAPTFKKINDEISHIQEILKKFERRSGTWLIHLVFAGLELFILSSMPKKIKNKLQWSYIVMKVGGAILKLV